MKENSHWDKKSLKALTKRNPDWEEFAKDCVCFANAHGGTIVFGIEDDESQPPNGQKIPDNLLSKLQKQIQGRTINVSIISQIKTAENNAEYIEILIKRNASAIASTSKGKYYIRIDDNCKPVLPDELDHLFADRGAYMWETQTHQRILQNNYD